MSLRKGAVIVMLLMLIGACAARHGQPVLGGSATPNPGGTISGSVRTTSGTPLEGRKVSAVDVNTGTEHDATTSAAGGYTIKVPTGRYRLGVELRPGEVIATQPALTTVNASDLDEARNFVIGL